MNYKRNGQNNSCRYLLIILVFLTNSTNLRGNFLYSLKKNAKTFTELTKELVRSAWEDKKVRYTIAGWLLSTSAGIILWRYLTRPPFIIGATTIDNKIPLKQFRVSVQPDAVNCGYHSAMNFLKIARYLMTGKWTELNENELFGSTGRWRKIIIDQRSEHKKDIDELDADEIKKVVYQEINQMPLTSTKVDFCAFDSKDVIGNPDADFITPQVKQNLKKYRGKPYIQGFSINTADGSSKDTIGHWITLILYQKPAGSRVYYTSDSIAGNKPNRIADEVILKLIDLLEQEDDK